MISSLGQQAEPRLRSLLPQLSRNSSLVALPLVKDSCVPANDFALIQPTITANLAMWSRVISLSII